MEQRSLTDADKKALARVKALCSLATANSPSETEVKIVCEGAASSGRVAISAWLLLRVLEDVQPG